MLVRTTLIVPPNKFSETHIRDISEAIACVENPTPSTLRVDDLQASQIAGARIGKCDPRFRAHLAVRARTHAAHCEEDDTPADESVSGQSILIGSPWENPCVGSHETRLVRILLAAASDVGSEQLQPSNLRSKDSCHD